MTLNSPVFIFLFLPIFLLIFWIVGQRFRLILLLVFSIAYYLWIDTFYAPFVFIWLALNFFAGAALEKNKSRTLFWIAIGANVAVLAGFKLITAGFFEMQTWPGWLKIISAKMPTGISFISFTTIAYLVDRFNGRIKTMTGFKDYALIQLFFPKIISGPIVRFPALEREEFGHFDLENLSNGIRRFIIGFSKKILIADVVGIVVNQVFTLKGAYLTADMAWIGILFYTLQIYYDFAGYTDMALGLGQIFGIKLPENFDFPYITRGIGEFWRRWHITLSNWFRDYIFFPLERIRRGKAAWLQHANVLVVFLLTGLWHGVTPNFIIWGLLHGVVIALENSKGIGGWIKKLPAFLQHSYAMGVVMVGWVFFRTESFLVALRYLKRMFTFKFSSAPIPLEFFDPIEGLTWTAFFVGVIFAMPVKGFLKKKLDWDQRFQRNYFRKCGLRSWRCGLDRAVHLRGDRQFWQHVLLVPVRELLVWRQPDDNRQQIANQPEPEPGIGL